MTAGTISVECAAAPGCIQPWRLSFAVRMAGNIGTLAVVVTGGHIAGSTFPETFVRCIGSNTGVAYLHFPAQTPLHVGHIYGRMTKVTVAAFCRPDRRHMLHMAPHCRWTGGIDAVTAATGILRA